MIYLGMIVVNVLAEALPFIANEYYTLSVLAYLKLYVMWKQYV